MKKYFLLLLLIIFLSFNLSGCYDANSVETFYYGIAMGIDYGDSSKYKLSVQIAQSNNSNSSNSSSQSTKDYIYTVECNTIDSGINILNNYLSKKIDLSHCSAIIFSEALAKAGIIDIINTLGNNVEIRPNANIIISNNTALDILENVSSSGENFSSRLYEFIINSSDYTGYSIISSLGDFFYNTNNSITESTANYISIVDNTIQNNGIAVFKNQSFIGNLTVNESIAHLIITNNLKSSVISIPNPFIQNEFMDLNLELKNINIDVSLINSIPYIKINSNVICKIKSASKEFDYSSTTNLSIIKNEVDKYLSDLIKKYLYKISREYNSDIAHFNEILSTKYLTADEFNKIPWENIFKDSVFEVSVDSNINSSYLFNKE